MWVCSPILNFSVWVLLFHWENERMTDFCKNRQDSGEDDNIYFITDLTHKNWNSSFSKN